MPVSGLRLDLHNHTSFSADGMISPGELLLAARARGIHCVAITDHNTTKGALQAAALAEADPTLPRVIPGIELSTVDGEIIGLYVQEDIPEGLPLAEAADRILGQGGVIYFPHPYELFRRGAVSRKERSRAAALASIVEVVNGRSLGPRSATKAEKLARRFGKAQGAGSDAHCKAEVGQAYVVIDALPTRDTLVALVAAGTVKHRLSAKEYTLNWGMQGLAPATRLCRRLAGRIAGE
jgi:predicted metal-dependent phosphoesterase TrpH